MCRVALIIIAILEGPFALTGDAIIYTRSDSHLERDRVRPRAETTYARHSQSFPACLPRLVILTADIVR